MAHTFRNYSLVEEMAQKKHGVHLDVRAFTESVLEIPYLVQQTSMISVIRHPLARIFRDVPRFKILELPNGAQCRAADWTCYGSAHCSLMPCHAWIRDITTREVVERSGESWEDF